MLKYNKYLGKCECVFVCPTFPCHLALWCVLCEVCSRLGRDVTTTLCIWIPARKPSIVKRKLQKISSVPIYFINNYLLNLFQYKSTVNRKKFPASSNLRKHSSQCCAANSKWGGDRRPGTADIVLFSASILRDTILVMLAPCSKSVVFFLCKCLIWLCRIFLSPQLDFLLKT